MAPFSARQRDEDSDSDDSFDLLNSDDEDQEADSAWISAFEGSEDVVESDDSVELLDTSPLPQLPENNPQGSVANQPPLRREGNHSRAMCPALGLAVAERVLEALEGFVMDSSAIDAKYLRIQHSLSQQDEVQETLKNVRLILACDAGVAGLLNADRFSEKILCRVVNDGKIEGGNLADAAAAQSDVDIVLNCLNRALSTKQEMAMVVVNPSTSSADIHSELTFLWIHLQNFETPGQSRFLVLSHPPSTDDLHAPSLEVQSHTWMSQREAAQQIVALLKEDHASLCRIYSLGKRPVVNSKPSGALAIQQGDAVNTVSPSLPSYDQDAPRDLQVKQAHPLEPETREMTKPDEVHHVAFYVATSDASQQPIGDATAGQQPVSDAQGKPPVAIRAVKEEYETRDTTKLGDVPFYHTTSYQTEEPTGARSLGDAADQPPAPREPPATMHAVKEESSKPPPSNVTKKPRKRTEGMGVGWMLSLQQGPPPTVPAPSTKATVPPTVIEADPRRSPESDLSPTRDRAPNEPTETKGNDGFKVQLYSQDKLHLLFGNVPKRANGSEDQSAVTPTSHSNPPPFHDRFEALQGIQMVDEPAQIEYEPPGQLPQAAPLGSAASSTGVPPTNVIDERKRKPRSRPSDFQWQLGLMASSATLAQDSVRLSTRPTLDSSERPKAGSSSSPRSRNSSSSWTPMLLRPDLRQGSQAQSPASPLDISDIYQTDEEAEETLKSKGKGKQREVVRESTPPRERSPAITYRNTRNDFAWQLALAATTLKPSDDYLKEQQERQKKRKIKLGQVPFDCLVCFETIEWEDGARMTGCEHAFCRECIGGHIQSKLEENQFPVVCPICLTDAKRKKRGFVDEELVLALELPEKVQDKFIDLQMAQLSVKLDCPGCKESMHIAREDYLADPYIRCPLPGCFTRFCRACRDPVDQFGQEPAHACKVDETLDTLMQENGWRYCPGCKTPVQKESGCNHMTCGAPGCSTHFCYTCGAFIWDNNSAQTLGDCISSHYANCVHFDPAPRLQVNNNNNNNLNNRRANREAFIRRARGEQCMIQ